ncbi:MAG: hypothetical protein PVF74_14170, partial [Anaerolineales bacterium]
LCLVVLTLAGCSGGYEQEYQFEYTFEEDQQGWTTDFADLPADYDPAIYELDSGWGELPSGLEGNAIFLSGHNRSDDLFMFLKVQADGLKPNTTYQAEFTIELASNVPEGLMGIGGSPGESVFVKAGATTDEPEVITDYDGWLRMNIDKGNQASEGDDMINLGTIANPNIDLETFTGEEYELMTLTSEGRDFDILSDGQGKVWLIAGTDSGFEGPTKVYYDRISIIVVEE